MRKDFDETQDFDGSKGLCCCYFENSRGARMIQYLDVLSILLLNLRSIFSFWSLYDDKRVEIYSRVRLVTFWVQWLFLFAIILAFVLYTVVTNEEGDNQFFLLISLATISFLLVFVLVDYHFCNVI